MIDNVKVWVREREILENHINKTNVVNLSTKLDLFSGVVEDCPLKGKYFNIDVVLTCKGAFVKGSVHKLTNLMKGGQNQNYNDLCFVSASETISHIIEALGLHGKTSLTNLEFGLNIKISKNPQEFLKDNLLMHDLVAHSRDDNFRGKGDLKSFQRTDYAIKIYNKGRQYGLKDYILRVEVKIITKRKLQKLGINRLEDLLKGSVIRRLYAFLWGEIQKLDIVDDYSDIKMPLEDRNCLNQYTNPNYWIKLSKKRSNKVKSNRRQRFNGLITKYGLDTTKKEILGKVSEKFSEMMECKAPNLKMVA